MVGFAETIFELVYVSQQKDFREFEKFFFYFTASGEFLAEVLGLYFIYEYVYPHVRNGGVGLWTFLSMLVKDPIHNVASPLILPDDDDFEGKSTGSFESESATVVALVAMIGLSNIYPNLAWVFFVPVWPGAFSDDDKLLKWWICGSFWILCLVLNLGSKYVPRGGAVFSSVGMPMWTYSFNKGVEIYLLFSRQNRLAGGFVGRGLRVLQLAEVSSTAFVLWQLCTNERYRRLYGGDLLIPIYLVDNDGM
ncbi:unnamed protein product [Sphacelaria rigidula]